MEESEETTYGGEAPPGTVPAQNPSTIPPQDAAPPEEQTEEEQTAEDEPAEKSSKKSSGSANPPFARSKDCNS